MKYAIAVISALCGLALSGCNTMEGIGQDIASGGQGIQNAANKVRADWREARARNEREYDTARAGCAGLSGADRDACLDRAHSRYSTEMSETRRTYPSSSLRAESEQERLENAYADARDRCERLTGAAEDQCIADARRRYNR